MPNVLIVDDDPDIRDEFALILKSDNLQVLTAATAGEAVELARQQRLDALLLDVKLPDRSGLEACAEIHKLDPQLPIIVITAYTMDDTAIEAVKRGAFQYLAKPIHERQLRDAVAMGVESRRRHCAAGGAGAALPRAAMGELIGRSPAIHQVFTAIARAAPQEVSVLILGETGTGKELVARALHRHSPRKEGPFLAVNCANIAENLLESEMFGHEKGAFTGAGQQHRGKFEQAEGGTLFLDEIGDLAPTGQAKVLRVLQEHSFERVGGSKTISTNVRVIAATHADLEERAVLGRFRLDLLHRLNNFIIRLAPLRERAEDVPVLAEHFLAVCNQKQGKNIALIDPETQHLLKTYRWPGNVRELQNVIEYAVICTTGDVLMAEALPERQRAGQSAAPKPAPPGQPGGFDLDGFVASFLDAGETDVHRKVIMGIEKRLFTQVLRFVEGKLGKAGAMLGMSAPTLRAKLRELGLAGGGM
jgi:two-component system nitrogen regulation response regulator GlnG